MIIDKLNEFGASFSVALAAGTANFTNVIDTSVVRDLGQGHPVYLILLCTGGTDGIITGGVAGTVSFQLVSDDSGTIATNGTQSVHLKTKDFVTDDNALNEIKRGNVIAVWTLPSSVVENYERYLGVQVVVGTTTITEGTVSAFLSLDPFGWKSYADGQN